MKYFLQTDYSKVQYFKGIQITILITSAISICARKNGCLGLVRTNEYRKYFIQGSEKIKINSLSTEQQIIM